MAENISKGYIVDASFVLAFLLPDEYAKNVDRKFELYSQNKIHFMSTYLLPFEVLNGLKIAVLRKRLNKKLATSLASNFFYFKIKLIKIDLKKSFLLALKRGLTIYDASYLYLTKSKNASLLTQDKRLEQLS